MKRKRFTEEQIISNLKELESGVRVTDLAHHRGVVENTIHRWKSRYDGAGVSGAKRLKVVSPPQSPGFRLHPIRLHDHPGEQQCLHSHLQVLSRPRVPSHPVRAR